MSSANAAHHVGKTLALHLARSMRYAAVISYGIYTWAVFFLVVVPACMLIMLSKQLADRRRMARAAARLLFRCVGLSASVKGLDQLPSAAHILVINHTSFLDAIVLTALLPAPPGYAFTACQEYRSQSILCPVLRALGLILLRSHDARHLSSNIEMITDALKRGESVIIFPEGHIAETPGLDRFHAGAFAAAAKAEVPVIVGALRGTRSALRLRTWLLRRVPVVLEIGSVLYATGKDRASIQAMRDRARQLMLPMTGEPDLTVWQTSTDQQE